MNNKFNKSILLLNAGKVDMAIEILNELIKEDIRDILGLCDKYNSYLVLIQFWHEKNDPKKAKYSVKSSAEKSSVVPCLPSSPKLSGKVRVNWLPLSS